MQAMLRYLGLISKSWQSRLLPLAAPLLAAILAAGTTQVSAQPSGTMDPKFWLTDGPVTAVVVTNGAIYLGGEFSYVGPRTGPAGVFDRVTGEWLASPPRINGIVRTVIPDGSGGWFIGGTFTQIGGYAITNLARLRSDLTPDTTWSARLLGQTINALALNNGVLYVGGSYQRIAGKTASGLVGISPDGRSVVWDPLFGGSANAIVVTNGLVYVGGNFFSIGNSNRQNIAAIDVNTARANDWNPVADQQVLALQVVGTTVYAGGQFTTIGTKPRSRMAALDAAGIASNWNPNPNGIVRAVAVRGNSVYMAGDFSTVGGQNRRGFGAVNSANGAAQPANLDIQPTTVPAGLVRAFALDGDSLYIGGSLTNALGALHRMVVGVNLVTSTALPTPEASDYNGFAGAAFGINAIALDGDLVFVAGDFLSIGGVSRQRAAAFSIGSGTALPWAPQLSAPPLAMLYGSNVIYLGGTFTNVNGDYVNSLAAVDPFQGTNRSNFRFLGTNQFGVVSINALGASSNRLFVGGAFANVADQNRRFLAALNPDNAAPISAFDAKLGGGFSGVTALAVVGTNLYVAGDFSSVNSQPVARLAKVSAVDGALRNWSPNPNQTVNALAVGADTLYVGGLFSQISGIAFKNFAAYSLADDSLGGVDASLPVFANGVSSIAATPTSLYVAGSYDAIGGEFRLNLANLAAFNASSFEWDPAPDLAPSVIAVTDQLAVVGGANRFFGRSPTNSPSGFLAVFPRGPNITRFTRIAGGNMRLVTTTGDRTDAVIEASSSPSGAAWTPIATNELPGFAWTIDLPLTQTNRFFRAVSR